MLAKGIAIILVVLGHFYPATSPNYWVELRSIIYAFHMPLFFILSGYLYVYGKYSYKNLIYGKIKRLLYPFAFVAAFFFFIKYFSGFFFNIQNPVNLDAVILLMLDPINSYMPLLWFVHALFLIFFIYPLLRFFVNDYVIFLIFFSFNLLLSAEIPVLGKSLFYMPYFVVGIMLRRVLDVPNFALLFRWRLSFLLLSFFCASYYVFSQKLYPSSVYYFIVFMTGIAGAFLFIHLSIILMNLKDSRLKPIFYTLGYYSMTIYFFHTLFESATRILLTQVLNDFNVPFIIIAFFSIIAGVIFPLFLERFVIRQFWFTKTFLLGISSRQ